MPEPSVLPDKYSEGPHGLGDPNDKSLRKVEIEVLIPKLMRDKAKAEKCIEEVTNFSKCCKESSVFMVFNCREENTALKSCLSSWYQNDEFRQLCTTEYLEKRSEYRSSGKKDKVKRM